MNIALSTFVVFIFLIPGLIFRRFYFSEEFSKQYLKQNYLEQFIASFLPSILFHILWFYFIRVFGYKINLTIVGYLFSTGKTTEIFSNVNQYSLQIILYHLSIFSFSALAGFIAKQIIRNFSLDRRRKIFRYQNSWHYLFSGEFFEFPRAAFDLIEDSVEEIEFFYIDVLVELSESTVLYEGILVEYELAKDGGLNYIVLKGAQRRFVKGGGGNTGMESEPYSLPGHILLIPYSSIININFSFYKLVEPEDENADYDYEVVLIQ